MFVVLFSIRIEVNKDEIGGIGFRGILEFSTWAKRPFSLSRHQLKKTHCWCFQWFVRFNLLVALLEVILFSCYLGSETCFIR